MFNNQITRILIVDGSSVTRALLSRTLREEIHDVEVVAVESGKQGLSVLETDKFDLITTSLMLPDMDGLELSRTVRSSKTHHYTPVIVVSGDTDARLLREGFATGVTDYFDKSLGYKAFGSFIKAFIQRNSGLYGHILFVEDSATAAAVTCKILEKHGLMVTHKTSAEEAFKLLEANNRDTSATQSIDLVITDFYLLGDMTGGDLLHAMRAKLHYTQQELPVLVLTSSDDQQTQIEVFHAGANDFVTKPIIEEVMMARVRALMLIKHQYDALKQQAETMRWIAATDSLTGVRSKRYLVDNGEDYLKDNSHQPVWAMLIDIDHFKRINDSLGHITGDHVLAELGDKLNSSFADAMVVRFGGEEFCILIANCSPESALERAETLRREIEQLRPINIDVTISIGLVSSLDYPRLTLTRFMSLADKALYAAKENGRNRVYIYTEEGTTESPWHGSPTNDHSSATS